MEHSGVLNMPQIGEIAPEFEAVTTQGIMHFPEDYDGQWVLLFSYPADFTPVCATEVMTLAMREKEFLLHNCAVIGLSVDSEYSHIAWLRNLREKAEYRNIKKVDIRFPIIADKQSVVAKKFGMIHGKHADSETVRTVIFIDPTAVIRAVLHYPVPNGRNIDELMRLLVAMQVSDEYKVATPADWTEGDDVVVPPPMTAPLADRRMLNTEVYTVTDWFLSFKPLAAKKRMSE